MSASGFNLPVRRIDGRPDGAHTTDASLVSIVGAPLPPEHTDEMGPPLGIVVASVLAAATVRAQQSSDVDQARSNTASRVPFALPIRRIVDDSSRREDSSLCWESVA